MNEEKLENHMLVDPENIYLVTRTGYYEDTEAPCEEAFKVIILDVDVRYFDDPKKVPAYKGDTDWWYKDGTNHRVEEGKIKRDLGTKKVWGVRISNIPTFINKHGTCEIRKNSDGFYEITILDY